MTERRAAAGGGVLLRVRLTPKGGRDAVDGADRDGRGRPRLRVRVAAPPADGEANAALIVLIAKTLGVPKSAVEIRAGATRDKTLLVAGAGLEARLAALLR